MHRKQMCVANVRYKRPTADEAKRAKNLLGYLTYRDSRDEGAKMVAGKERWVDHGMGGGERDCATLRRPPQPACADVFAGHQPESAADSDGRAAGAGALCPRTDRAHG